MVDRARSERVPVTVVEDAASPWPALKPETLVDKVIQTVIEAAARGTILPGDRIVETDLAQRLGISRIPIREALRILESQGVVVNEPYKGIRLTPVTSDRIDHLIEARIALETTAATRAIAQARNGPDEIAALGRMIDELDLMNLRGDAFGFASADTAFHRVFVGLGGNAVVVQLWEMLARQMTIIFGLSTLAKPMPEIVDEHRRLAEVFGTGDVEALCSELDDHISAQTHAVDIVGVIDRRRIARDRAAAAGT